MQSLGVKVNGTNPIPTIVVLYIMIPFSNLSKHKKKSFSIGFTTIFCAHLLPKCRKNPVPAIFFFYIV
jgi:hypothetical protein